MPKLRLAPLFGLAAFAALAVVAPASASEAFLCDGQRIVYVEFGDLERLKKTDPCIAGYFGLKVDPAAVTTPGAGAIQPVPPSPAPAAASPPTGLPPTTEARPVLRGLSEPEVSAPPHRIDSTPQRVRTIPLPGAIAPPSSVRLINADPPNTLWVPGGT